MVETVETVETHSMFCLKAPESPLLGAGMYAVADPSRLRSSAAASSLDD